MPPEGGFVFKILYKTFLQSTLCYPVPSEGGFVFKILYKTFLQSTLCHPVPSEGRFVLEIICSLLAVFIALWACGDDFRPPLQERSFPWREVKQFSIWLPSPGCSQLLHRADREGEWQQREADCAWPPHSPQRGASTWTRPAGNTPNPLASMLVASRFLVRSYNLLASPLRTISLV